eukprot:365920-Chlamydomonas_euryale.AAC.5
MLDSETKMQLHALDASSLGLQLPHGSQAPATDSASSPGALCRARSGRLHAHPSTLPMVATFRCLRISRLRSTATSNKRVSNKRDGGFACNTNLFPPPFVLQSLMLTGCRPTMPARQQVGLHACMHACMHSSSVVGSNVFGIAAMGI